MARAFYSEINLHLTWHTKHNQPTLTPEVEALAHRLLRRKALDTDGVFFHEVGGTVDHVHLALSVLPTVRVCDLVGQLKGFSAHEANAALGRGGKVLQWQGGYGVVSFGTRDLEWVRRYVQKQKQHHARGTTHERLEWTVEVVAAAGREAGGGGRSREAAGGGEQAVAALAPGRERPG